MKRHRILGLLLLAAALSTGGKTMSTRIAVEGDLDAMVRLAAVKRAEYQAYQPVFHKVANDADVKQRLFLKNMMGKPDVLLLVHKQHGNLDGWLYLRLVSAPPVYRPGGLIATVDDFVVQDPSLWPSTGKALITDAKAWAKERGAILINVVCSPQDRPKRAWLDALGLSVASEWHVGELKD